MWVNIPYLECLGMIGFTAARINFSIRSECIMDWFPSWRFIETKARCSLMFSVRCVYRFSQVWGKSIDSCMVYLHVFTHIYHKINIPYMDAMDVFFFWGGTRGGIICFSTCCFKSTICAEFVDRFWDHLKLNRTPEHGNFSQEKGFPAFNRHRVLTRKSRHLQNPACKGDGVFLQAWCLIVWDAWQRKPGNIRQIVSHSHVMGDTLPQN